MGWRGERRAEPIPVPPVPGWQPALDASGSAGCALRGLYKYAGTAAPAPRVPVSDVTFGGLLSNPGKCFGGSNFSAWQSHILMQLG